MREFVETESGNRVSKIAKVLGSQYIIIAGKSTVEDDVALNGDCWEKNLTVNTNISTTGLYIGRYCYLDKGCVLSPPCRKLQNEAFYYPLKMGNYVFVGKRTTIEAAQIGSYVYIGNDVKIGAFAIIKDCVYIPDGAEIPPNTVVPPFSRLSAEPPSRVIKTLPESSPEVFEADARARYARSPSVLHVLGFSY